MNGRTRAVPLRAERPHLGGMPMASAQMAFLVSCTMLLTVLWGSLSRADVWVTVNPGGTVTRTEVVAPKTAPVPPEIAAQVSVAGNTTTAGSPHGLAPRHGYGIALDQYKYGVALDQYKYGVALQPQTPYPGTGHFHTGQTYSGVYPGVPSVSQGVVGYPYYPQQPHYPQPYYGQPNYPGYYPAPAPGYYVYQPGPYTVPVGNGHWPATVTHIPGSTIYYAPAPYGCNVCHRNPCSGHHGHGHGYSHGTVYHSTRVSPSGSVTVGNRGVQFRINSGRTTTSTTSTNVISPSRLPR